MTYIMISPTVRNLAGGKSTIVKAHVRKAGDTPVDSNIDAAIDGMVGYGYPESKLRLAYAKYPYLLQAMYLIHGVEDVVLPAEIERGVSEEVRALVATTISKHSYTGYIEQWVHSNFETYCNNAMRAYRAKVWLDKPAHQYIDCLDILAQYFKEKITNDVSDMLREAPLDIPVDVIGYINKYNYYFDKHSGIYSKMYADMRNNESLPFLNHAHGYMIVVPEDDVRKTISDHILKIKNNHLARTTAITAVERLYEDPTFAATLNGELTRIRNRADEAMTKIWDENVEAMLGIVGQYESVGAYEWFEYLRALSAIIDGKTAVQIEDGHKMVIEPVDADWLSMMVAAKRLRSWCIVLPKRMRFALCAYLNLDNIAVIDQRQPAWDLAYIDDVVQKVLERYHNKVSNDTHTTAMEKWTSEEPKEEYVVEVNATIYRRQHEKWKERRRVAAKAYAALESKVLTLVEKQELKDRIYVEGKATFADEPPRMTTLSRSATDMESLVKSWEARKPSQNYTMAEMKEVVRKDIDLGITFLKYAISPTMLSSLVSITGPQPIYDIWGLHIEIVPTTRWKRIKGWLTSMVRGR